MPPSGGTRISLRAQADQLSGTWGGGFFSPGTPPVADTQEPVRKFDFVVGQNYNRTPRAYEPYSFASLRSFSNVELVRLAIESRKDQMERLEWRIKPRHGREGRADQPARIRAAEKFWRKPDGVTPFSSWLRLSLEDLLVLDAPAFEMRRTRSGQLLGMEIVPGDTIKVNVDETGRIPLAPLPAYQQIIKGKVWNDLTTQDLLYVPRNRRPNKLYGFGPVEQIIVTINTILRRQAAQLAYFTEGNIPQGLLTAPEGWSPENLREFQEHFEARLAGNQAERSKLIWVPFGTKYENFKEAPLKDEFDEWLARIVCYALSLPPTAFIRQTSNSAAKEDDDRSAEEGQEPVKLWWKRIADDVIQEELGFTDLEWGWVDVRDVDAKTQAANEDLSLRNGSITIDEVRARRGLDPLPDGMGAKPMIYTTLGAIPLEKVDELAQSTIDANQKNIDSNKRRVEPPKSGSSQQQGA